MKLSSFQIHVGFEVSVMFATAQNEFMGLQGSKGCWKIERWQLKNDTWCSIFKYIMAL